MVAVVSGAGGELVSNEIDPGFLDRIPGFASFDAAAQADLLSRLQAQTLKGGEVLFHAGDQPDGLVMTVRGRLGVLDARGDVAAVLGRNEVVGEIGALTGMPRTSTVVALRDTEIVRLDQASFDAVYTENPELARAFSRLVVTRLTVDETALPEHGGVAAVAIVAVDDGLPIDAVTDALVSVAGTAAVIREADVGDRDEAAARSLLDRAEAENELLILVAGSASERRAWLERCLRQADAVVVVVPPVPNAETRRTARDLGESLQGFRATVEVAVANPAAARLGANASEWAQLLRADRLHHLRRDDRAVAARFARLVTGQGVALVLSGGGAKGLAHLGAWRALNELGVEIDAVAGVSLGALLGAGIALDYSPAELRDEVEARLVRQKGLADPTFPWLSLLRGEEVSRRIRDVGQGRMFEQTWRPFICTSCDLSTGETVVHRRGLLWKAIRASLSIPGVFPPLRDGDRLLVDGAVRDNLPVSSLREAHPTPMKVIAIDVGKEGFLEPGETPDRGALSGWSLVRQRLNPRRAHPNIPTMVQVLMRVVDLAGQQNGDPPEVLVRPRLQSLRLSEFTQIDSFDRAGYDAVIAALGSPG